MVVPFVRGLLAGEVAIQDSKLCGLASVQAPRRHSTYVTEYGAAFSKHLRLVVVIDIEPRKEDLILIRCHRTLT